MDNIWSVKTHIFVTFQWYSHVHTNPFSNETGAVFLRFQKDLRSLVYVVFVSFSPVHATTPKTITKNGAIRKHSPEWSDLKTMLFSSVDGENDAIWKQWRHQNKHDRAPDHSTVSIQNGWETPPCGFNFAPISRADILKCACVESFEPARWGYKSVFKTDTAL